MIKISKLLGLRKKPQPEETSVPAETEPDIWQRIEGGEIDEGKLYSELCEKDLDEMTDDEADFWSAHIIHGENMRRVETAVTELLHDKYAENLGLQTLADRHYHNPFTEITDFLIRKLPRLIPLSELVPFAEHNFPKLGGFILREISRTILKHLLRGKDFIFECKIDVDSFKSKIPEDDFPLLRRNDYDHDKLHDAYAEMINAIALLFVKNFESEEQRKYYVPFYFNNNMAINLFSTIDKQLQDPLLSKLSHVPIIRDWWKIINESRGQKKQ